MLAWPVLAVANPLAAQVVRLPAIDLQEEDYAGRLVSHPDSTGEVLAWPGDASPTPVPDLPPDARPGMFQKLVFSGTWLAPGGDGLGISDLELKSILAVPFPTRLSPLIITPGFAVHYFDGPSSTDLPPRVYDAYTQFRWMSQVLPSLGVDLAITPGVFSDFRQSTDEQLRITGHGAAALTCSPTAKIVLGVGYFDRLDVRLMPIGGLIWAPNEDTSLELLFPQPRIARRVYFCGTAADDVQDWIYLAGEFGGGTWAIQRANGANDVVNYHDIRVILGVERKVIGAPDGRLEVGYIFGRKVEYHSRTPEFQPSDTVMLRGGITY